MMTLQTLPLIMHWVWRWHASELVWVFYMSRVIFVKCTLNVSNEFLSLLNEIFIWFIFFVAQFFNIIIDMFTLLFGHSLDLCYCRLNKKHMSQKGLEYCLAFANGMGFALVIFQMLRCDPQEFWLGIRVCNVWLEIWLNFCLSGYKPVHDFHLFGGLVVELGLDIYFSTLVSKSTFAFIF